MEYPVKWADIIMLLAALLAAIILFQPRLLKSPLWRAIGTPLASIIGSGFLVAGPVLAHVAGNWAFVAMLALCGLAYMFGAIMRFNIEHVESLTKSPAPPKELKWLERISSFSLAFAYFISVAYYLNLLAAFGLKAGGVTSPEAANWVASAVIIALGTLGSLKGLHALEDVELPAVNLKLSLICGMLTALLAALFISFTNGGPSLSEMTNVTGTEEIRILLGLVILVQGFETSRYLGDSYDKATRIQTMRYAQWISTGVYFVFILLVTPYFKSDLPVNGGETQIIDMLAAVGVLVAPVIILTALASQLSAAVADMNGAGGLLEDASNSNITVRGGYFITALMALIITWSADIFEIITYASKAFMLYYGLQCITALIALKKIDNIRSTHRTALQALFLTAALIALLIVVLGKAVS